MLASHALPSPAPHPVRSIDEVRDAIAGQRATIVDLRNGRRRDAADLLRLVQTFETAGDGELVLASTHGDDAYALALALRRLAGRVTALAGDPDAIAAV